MLLLDIVYKLLWINAFKEIETCCSNRILDFIQNFFGSYRSKSRFQNFTGIINTTLRNKLLSHC